MKNIDYNDDASVEIARKKHKKYSRLKNLCWVVVASSVLGLSYCSMKYFSSLEKYPHYLVIEQEILTLKQNINPFDTTFSGAINSLESSFLKEKETEKYLKYVQGKEKANDSFNKYFIFGGGLFLTGLVGGLSFGHKKNYWKVDEDFLKRIRNLEKSGEGVVKSLEKLNETIKNSGPK